MRKLRLSLLLTLVLFVAGTMIAGEVLAAGINWFNEDWLYRKQITINSSQVPGNLTNFPVLINRTDHDWKDTANGGKVEQADGGDIVITASDGTTQLDHEIEEYDPSTGKLVAWVEVPAVSSTIDTVIYLYYGNPAPALPDQWDVAGTWDEEGDNNFIMVQHLNEAPDDDEVGHIDRSPISDPKKVPYNFMPQDFQDGGGGTTDAVGKIGGADKFDGTDDFLASDPALIGGNKFTNVYFVDHWSNVPADPNRNGTWTLSAWVKTPTAGRIFFQKDVMP